MCFIHYLFKPSLTTTITITHREQNLSVRVYIATRQPSGQFKQINDPWALDPYGSQALCSQKNYIDVESISSKQSS